jgi:hypothetical protein
MAAEAMAPMIIEVFILIEESCRVARLRIGILTIWQDCTRKMLVLRMFKWPVVLE